jgi:hypothetical protein
MEKGGGSRGKARLEPALARGRVSWRWNDFHAETALEPVLASALTRAGDLNLKDMARLRGG